MRTIVGETFDYKILLGAGCSNASNPPEGIRKCSCYAHREQLPHEKKMKRLESARPITCCGQHPTKIQIQLKEKIASPEWWKQHKDLIMPWIGKYLDEMGLGRNHEKYYENDMDIINKHVIEIQLVKNFQMIKDEYKGGNTTPEK